MASLLLFNTLTRKKEVFKPLKKNMVGLYTCGPTVYNFAHIGNLRTYIFADILKRALRYNGYTIRHIMNITDVGHLNEDQDFGEDKIERAAKKTGKTPHEIARFYTKAFLADLKKLNIIPADAMPKATQHINEQIAIIKTLIARGYAYETELAVYFDVSKFKRYFDFSLQKKENIKHAVRGEIVIDKNKKNPADFALWFKRVGRYASHALYWSSPWGNGFPGWHIECSAMSVTYLGQPFDIHTGGVDHIFPHHSNEIAQSEAFGGKPLARYWLHGEFLLINKARMGKSQSNFIRLADLEANHAEPLAYRYFALLTHYRKKVNFTFEALERAARAFQNLKVHIVRFYGAKSTTRTRPALIKEYRAKTERLINEDLNTPRVLALLWNVIRSKELYDKEKYLIALEIDDLLGLNLRASVKKTTFVPADIQQLVQKRENFRKEKKWSKSDKIREQLRTLG